MASPLTIGNLTLTGLELPARMPFGGTQRVTIHRLPGGGRVIDAMGSDDRDVTWSGYLMGALAVSRARQLDAMRAAGAAVTLSWADFRRSCVVTAFEPDYESAGNVVPYSITVCLLPDASPAPAPTAQAQANALLQDADTELVDQVSNALTAASAAISAAGAFGGSGSAAALSVVVGAAGVAGTVQAAGETTLGAVAVDGGQLLSGTDALSLLSSLNAASAGVQQQVSGLVAAARLGRVEGLL